MLIFVDNEHRKRSHSQLDTCVRAPNPNYVFSVIAVQLLFSVVLVVVAAAVAAFVAAAAVVVAAVVIVVVVSHGSWSGLGRSL